MVKRIMDIERMGEEDLLSMVKEKELPRHVAIIMDGNGRWAKARRLPRIAGHQEGIKSVREVTVLSRELGIGVLTFYAFSVENWKRPRKEVEALMIFLEEYLQKELMEMMENNIRFKAVGRIKELPLSVQHWIREVERKTENNKAMILNLALSYGGRAEIVDAVISLIEDIKAKRSAITEINEDFFSKYLYTEGLPDPDLLIRTSGEQRISNFLLWQMAYTELYFTKTLWPDFRRREMLLALLDYQHRERRFGLTGDQLIER